MLKPRVQSAAHCDTGRATHSPLIDGYTHCVSPALTGGLVCSSIKVLHNRMMQNVNGHLMRSPNLVFDGLTLTSPGWERRCWQRQREGVDMTGPHHWRQRHPSPTPLQHSPAEHGANWPSLFILTATFDLVSVTAPRLKGCLVSVKTSSSQWFQF